MTRRRGRNYSNAERTQRNNERMLRRESLLVLLSRAQRGVLTPTEGNLLRAHVETELADADTHHRNARGSQAAAQRYRKQAAAAEDTIRETEQQLAAAEKQLAEYRAVFGPNAPYGDAVRRAEQAEADVKKWLAFIERGLTTHMRFGVIGEDGTTEMQPCADWCYACRLENAEQRADRAEATVTRAEAVRDQWRERLNPNPVRELLADLDTALTGAPTPADPCDCGHPTPHRRADCGGTAEPFLGDQPAPDLTGDQP